MKKSFKALRGTKEKIVGQFLFMGYPEMAELAAHAGYDFVLIDNEHGIARIESICNAIRAAEAEGIVPLVRVPDVHDEAAIKKALDCGAAGVVVPGIATREQAELGVKYSKFTPLGNRGACPYVRANGYGSMDPIAFYPNANCDVALVLLVEGQEGIDNFDEIISVEGVDGVFFGPVDLSLSLGVPGEVNHPLVEEAIKDMVKKAKEKGVFVGMYGDSIEDSRRWFDNGCEFVIAMVDSNVLYRANKHILDAILE